MRLVVAYDVSEDYRRERIAKVLEGFGRRVQYSVFECDLNPAERSTLRSRLVGKLGPRDSILSYPLCEACRRRIEVQGSGKFMEVPVVVLS